MAQFLDKNGKEFGTINDKNRREVRYIHVEKDSEIEEKNLDVYFGITEVGYYYYDEEKEKWKNIPLEHVLAKKLIEFMELA